MPNARFTEAELQAILNKLKISLHGAIRECKALTSNIGQLVRLAQIEQTLKHPEALGGDTVHQLNTYQTMLNEVKAFIKAIEEGSATALAA
jgi:aspartate carbamoyltransferase catalytic subunit